MEKCHNAEFQTKAGAKDMRSSKKRRNSTTKKRRDKMIQPLLPKTASDVSSNWKALSSVSDISLTAGSELHYFALANT